MARLKEVPAEPLTLSPDKAIPILENLILTAESLHEEESDSGQRKQWRHTGEGALLASLGNKHPSVRAFVAAQCGVYHLNDSEARLRRQANEQLGRMVAVLKSTVEQLRWQLPDPAQVFLPAGSTHDAYVEIRKIIQSATSEILVVDSYVDGTLWALLTNLPASAKIRVMTMQMKGDFALEGRKFAAQHGNVIEVRQTRLYHDRFVVTDEDRCWHLGASIKDAGNKAFAMSEILSATIRTAIKRDLDTTWNAAASVPL